MFEIEMVFIPASIKLVDRLRLETKLFKMNCLNPKGSELLLNRLKSGEIQMEDRTPSDAQIDGII